MNNKFDKLAVIILAAGLGTRMKSTRAKVLHEICGKPMLAYVQEIAMKIAGPNVIIVTGHQAEEVEATSRRTGNCRFAFQQKQLGTGNAVKCALPFIDSSIKDVVILCGDVPLIRADTIADLIENHRNENNKITVLGVKVDNPTGYGRIITDRDGKVKKIIEEADADSEVKKINIVNTGIYCVNADCLDKAIQKIQPNNNQGEYYLTDIIQIGNENEMKIGMAAGDDPDEVKGVNSVEELAYIEKLIHNAN